MPAPTITLTSDFGLRDGFAAAMTASILGILPKASIVDISHDVSPQDVAQGGFVVGSVCPRFPVGTVHVAVVDPGVGTTRRPILLEAGGQIYVAPDNGILTYVLAANGAVVEESRGVGEDGFGIPLVARVPKRCAAYVLSNEDYWLAPISRTFHGRDVFAPVAAHVASGVEPNMMGDPIDTVTFLNLLRPARQADVIHGRVIQVDRFGNLVTNIPTLEIDEDDIVVDVCGSRIEGLSESYASGGGLLAIFGSHGYLEIAMTDGDAARLLQAGFGTPVTATTGQPTCPD